MKTFEYNDLLYLAAELAGRTRDKLPLKEQTMLLAFFAAELPTLWDQEAWPPLCDNLEAITLDDSKCFSTREGDETEMGNILAILTGDPRISTIVTGLPSDKIIRLDGRVNLVSTQTTVWVDWQLPAPDLLAVSATALPTYELPAIFKLILAYKGAEHLLRADGDLATAGVFHGLAETQILKETARANASRPWWRRGVNE